MLLDAGLPWVILGHSERRHVIGETDEASVCVGLVCTLCAAACYACYALHDCLWQVSSPRWTTHVCAGLWACRVQSVELHACR